MKDTILDAHRIWIYIHIYIFDMWKNFVNSWVVYAVLPAKQTYCRKQPTQYNINRPAFNKMLSRIGNTQERNHLINQRRRIENHRNEYLAATKETKTVGLRVKWEENTSNKILKNRVREKLDHLRQERRRQLDKRRDALAEKLSQESLLYEQELDSLQETPMQRRSRMQQRAKELKEQRMSRDLEFNKKMLEKKFRYNSFRDFMTFV